MAQAGAHRAPRRPGAAGFSPTTGCGWPSVIRDYGMTERAEAPADFAGRERLVGGTSRRGRGRPGRRGGRGRRLQQQQGRGQHRQPTAMAPKRAS